MGSFGLVWKAKCTLTQSSLGESEQEVAIKIIDLEQFHDNSIEEIRKEISIMSQCAHKNVV
jgi:serine/threonine protein kinase